MIGAGVSENKNFHKRNFPMLRTIPFQILSPKKAPVNLILLLEHSYEKSKQQAGAELGQAQLQLELGFTLLKVCCIIWMITNYHYISLSTIGLNFVTSTYLHTSLLNC